MGIERLKNLLLVLVIILIIVGIPYLLYALGGLIQIDYFGYINNWWIVLLFIVLLISVFVVRGIDFEKNMASFFLILFTVPFFILGIHFGRKPMIDEATYNLLVDKEQEIDRLDATLLKMENNLAESGGGSIEEQAAKTPDFSNHAIIFFHSGSTELSDFNKDRITTFISSLENCRLNINGYSDDLGDKASNKIISEERARNVADFIQSMGQQNNTINAVAGFGDDHQLVTNGNEISRSKNRRVTIEIVGKTNESATGDRKKVWDEINEIRAEMEKIKEERDSLLKVIY